MLYLHEATAEVHGRFPVDMLCYESCFPATAEDAAAIVKCMWHVSGVLRVKLQAFSKNKQHWTPERWANFGVHLVEGASRKA